MAGPRNNSGKRSRSQTDYTDSGGRKRRNGGGDRDQLSIDSDDTVYRYLCPGKRIGSIIGRGGEIVKQLRADTNSKIRIGETVPGCDERVITIYSPSDETNSFGDSGNFVSPAQDALFRVHDKVVAEELQGNEDSDASYKVIARLLVPSDQIGCIIGKGGQVVQNLRTDTGAQIRILKDEHLPPCALSSDELVQISGEAPVVKKAIYQIASRLHDNPSRSQHLLASAPSLYPTGGTLMGPPAGAPIMGLTPIVGPYGGYKGDSGDWSRSFYSAPRGDSSPKEFSLRLVCPTVNIGGVIGKGGVIINELRQQTRATIKVDSSSAEGDDCLITILAMEVFEDRFSPTIEAAVRLQPRCSEKLERDSGLVSYTTRLLVPSSRIGCLIGKGGAIITDMRKLTKASIRILPKEDLPKVASKDDEMVQIAGDLDVAKDALLQVITRLRANFFDKEGALSAFMPVLSYLPPSADDGLNYETRDSRRHGRDHSYSGGYGGSSDLAGGDGYGGYGASQVGGRGSGYGAYSGYSSGRSGPTSGSGLGHNSGSRRKNYDY